MEQFSTGSKRDTQDGKLRYDLIPQEALDALARLYAEGAEYYGDDNWRLGQPRERVVASLLRHVYSVRKRDDNEDHYSRAIFNIMMLFMMDKGYIPSPTDDDLHITVTIAESVDAEVDSLFDRWHEFTQEAFLGNYAKEDHIVVLERLTQLEEQGKLRSHIANVLDKPVVVYTSP